MVQNQNTLGLLCCREKSWFNTCFEQLACYHPRRSCNFRHYLVRKGNWLGCIVVSLFRLLPIIFTGSFSEICQEIRKIHPPRFVGALLWQSGTVYFVTGNSSCLAANC